MAHFRATIRGQRGQASRLGSKKSGITASINGWDLGVMVSDSPDNGFIISINGGSNGGAQARDIGRVFLIEGKPQFVPEGK